MGYRNVFVYNEGLPEWKKRGFPVTTTSVYPSPKIPSVSGQELKVMLDRKDNIVVIDLRDEEDRKMGWIKGSINIDMEILDEKTKEIPKGKKIVLLDLHGKQTYLAARFLTKEGFKDIVMLDKGFYDGWLKAGLPVVK